MDTLYILPILLFSVVVHEVAHGWTALKLGDPTAHDMGRITLNPIPHLDLIGSIILPILIVVTSSPFFIAWAKPVPVNPYNFRNYRRDDILVSLAGPASNLMMALVCTITYVVISKIFILDMYQAHGFMYDSIVLLKLMFYNGIYVNIFLAIFNLIPVPPLDGSHVIASLLPEKIGEQYRQIGFFGIIAVILLMRLEPFRIAIITIINIISTPLEIIINLFA